MDEATLAQVRAADPAGSTWLAANAGSGKTKVLTDRVARLLLGGADPARILCLTYTKAAAAEMQNRLFGRLGQWAMYDDARLAAALADLGEPVTDPDTMARARRLFARALETPGGLKIQTIHAFCAAVLRRFPLEAGVPPDFAEVDERSLERLRERVLDGLAARPRGAAVLEGLLSVLSEGKLRPLLAEIEGLDPALPDDLPEPGALFGLAAGFDRAALLAQVFTGDEAAVLPILPALAASERPTDRTLAERLAVLARPGAEALEVLESALLYGAGAKKSEPFSSKAGTMPTRDLRKSLPADTLAALDALADRVAQARPLRLALEAAEQTAAVWAFARAWLPAIAAAKAARGWLQFDDLVALTRRLLAEPSVAQWVLYKLDGGIDHILVDEAQDTAPAQWEIIERLVAELTAGEGARPRPRSLFVVGDRKQSIYSFQGADLRGFESVRERLARGLAGAGRGLDRMQLLHSFRSSPAVLRVVDLAFAGDPGGLGGITQHLAFQPDKPGRVDLWPALPPPPKAEVGEWDDPLDRPATTHPDLVLAGAVAAELRRLIDAGTAIVTRNGPERLHEGHVLILVRRRKGLLFDALLQACKGQGLAMAGADRLVLTEEPAVIDILSLLRVLALPEDDLSLATALRSALFGWSEERLFRLAHGRGRRPLIAALRDDPGAAGDLAVLQDLRDATDFLRPYELIERLLGRHDGRRRLLARFGPEAEEPLDALSELALAYEREEVPTLDGFLGWLDASDAELKRQVEGAGHRLRIMTVHGAKGLEAPLVILPDTADRNEAARGVLTRVAGLPVPRAPADSATPEQAAAVAAEAALRAEERDRLLYVALTRAESWLIVAGAGKTDAPDGWYGRVAAGLAAAGTVPVDTPLGPGVRHAHGDWPAVAAAAAADAPAVPPVPLALPPAPARPAPLAPTGLGGAKALPGEAGDPEPVALARGRLVHALLEHLPACPRGDWPGLAQRLARAETAVLGPDAAITALAEAQRLLDDPALAGLFGPGALAEVALAGAWQGRVLRGVLDRVLVGPDRVLAVDLKTNRTVPDAPEAVPEGLLRQMGAYAHLLAGLHPGRRIETALLWTATGRLMPLPPALTAAALARATADAGADAGAEGPGDGPPGPGGDGGP